MTRINIGIGVRELCDQHLVAEYRELPRIRSMVIKIIESGRPLRGRIPETFTLGPGHMLYFADKGAWLHLRWLGLRGEMSRRGMQPSLEWREFPTHYERLDLCKWISSTTVMRVRPLLKSRIRDRLVTGHPTNPRWTRSDQPAWTLETSHVS